MSSSKLYIKDIPNLICEWDWEKNSKIGLDPNKLSHGSTKYAFWVCGKGHSFKARIDHRCIMKSGCPYCANKLPIVGENDLATLNPELLKEWNYEKNKQPPTNYKQYSNKKVWWICSTCGYEWKTQINHRTLRDAGCPECAKQTRAGNRVKNLINKNGSLQDQRPDLALEWDTERNAPLTARDVTIGSSKKIWWKCPTCGHSYQQSVADRCNGRNCSICNGKVVIKGYNDLASQFPELIPEWHKTKNNDFLPNQVTAFNDRKVWWQCTKCNYEWEAKIYNRTRLKSGCPACANQVVTVGKNDLNTTHPHLAAEWDQTKNGDVTPSNVFANSNKKYWWRCSEGHIWKAAVSSRAAGRGCPTCAKEKRVITFNKNLLDKRGSLLDTNPELAKQWHLTKNGELTPSDVLAGSDRKVWWICQKGHEWEASISSRVYGNGCPECKKELSTSFPEQVIYYYLSKVTNAVNRYKIYDFEIDIYLPGIFAGIEYNGKYYHKNRQDKDENKVAELSKHGIRVIRIEEGEKNEIKGDIIFFKLIKNNYTHLDFAINAILDIFSLPKISIDIKNDTPAIHQSYLTLEKSNSLASKRPWLIDEWNNSLNGTLTPWQISYGSSKKVWWKCTKCNYEWEAVVYSRKKNGCPRCAGKVITPGYNDLATLNPKLTTEWDYEKNTILPTEISPNSHNKAWWKCANGHSWEAQIQSRNKGCGCPICYKTKEKK